MKTIAEIGKTPDKYLSLMEKAFQFDDMAHIPAGNFVMGSNAGGEFESPEHQVYLDDFWIDKKLVTNRQFSQFVNETGYITTAEKSGAGWGYQNGKYGSIHDLSWKSYASKERFEHPVVMVSWYDAMAYAEWAGKKLPTEAQWEKAARGGLICKPYPWGDMEPNDANCGFSIKPPNEIPATSRVMLHTPNNYGVYDMVGNVWQWCADWYQNYYYHQSPIGNPLGPNEGNLRVRRGGAWNVIQGFRLRCANRGAVPPETVVPNMGIRCVLNKSL